MLNRKGFLGPIGDDLPSLIPLLFALLIFFSTFAFALNSFNQTNALISDKLESLRVARKLRVNGYISNYEQFQDLCDSITRTSISFQAGLIDLRQTTGDYGFVSGPSGEINFITEQGNEFKCISNDLEGVDPADFDYTYGDEKAFSLIYPIVLERNKVVVPVHLVVVAWKQ